MGMRILPYGLREGGIASYSLRVMPPVIREMMAVCLGAALVSAPALCRAQEPETPPAEKPPPTPSAPQKSLLKQIDEGFVEVYEKVVPAVVIIVATKKLDESEPEDPKGFDFLFTDKEPHGDLPKPTPHPWRLPPQPARNEGSGFFIRSDGYILTNLHVVFDAETVSVRLKDGRMFNARIVAADDKTDIAVIKIEAKDLPTVELGDSDALRIGQLVCAIGTPFNQDFSFTCGWVSGKGRSGLLGPTSTAILYEDYIQTDAFINPGNSGGPLFDVEGKVIGMNTLINGLNRGLAFAIPSNVLEQISSELISSGKIVRPWLGIRFESLGDNPILREHANGLDRGVVVDTIEANAPASKSDLRPADIITEMDGVKIATGLELQKEVLKKHVGQSVQLTIWRAGQMLTIPVLTGELPNEVAKIAVIPELKKAAPPAPPTPLDPKDEGYGMKLKDAKAGAQVVEVAPESAAAVAELQADDVITDVEGKQISDSAACLAAIRSAGERSNRHGVLLNLERKGKRTWVVLNPDK